MKKIFVTVQEFLDNGGKIQPARPIYNKSGIRFSCDEWFWNHYITAMPKNTYVQIDCTPHYV